MATALGRHGRHAAKHLRIRCNPLAGARPPIYTDIIIEHACLGHVAQTCRALEQFQSGSGGLWRMDVDKCSKHMLQDVAAQFCQAYSSRVE